MKICGRVNSISHNNFIVYMGNFADRRRCIYHKGEVVGWDLGGVGVDNFPPLYIDRLEPKHPFIQPYTD